MQGAQILRNEAYREVRLELVEWPFGFTQGRESFDLAQDRELVERQMDFLRNHHSSVL